jgi:tetratricopeptide (TPR) repeat protein
LDNPAYDSIELVFGGKFSVADEERIREGFEGPKIGQLPWVVLNNKGILEFLDGRYDDARRSYEELNRRIPNNIIFLYRLGLCHAILAFQNTTRSFWGKILPNPKHLKSALDSLRKAILIGESREVGKQKCVTIRKTIAEILEKIGKVAESKKMWKQIKDMQPRSKEAVFKLQGAAALLAAASPKKR